MDRTGRLTGAIVATLMVLAVGPAVVAAQPMAGETSTYGTVSEIAHTVGFSAFEGEDSGSGWLSTCTGGPASGCAKIPGSADLYFAALTLPAGALVTRIELDGCDSDGARQLQFGLLVATGRVGSGVVVPATGTTGLAASPGCALFNVPLATPLTVDNAANTYTLFTRPLPSPAFGIAFTAIRVYYTLQVSAAPAAATFGDVPTSHPFFQFVEALVASGITAGCGGGNYCPDAPLTRGQMAVFLSKGLGLHFAP